MLREKWDRLSIQKKLFIGMLTISIIVVTIITGTALRNTYQEMNEQLIYNRRMSIGWLGERLGLELSGYQEQFYEFEVNQTLKSAIQDWCLHDVELDYENRWRLITAMNEAVSMDSDLNGMEIYNLKTDEVLIAQRSGASLEATGGRLQHWEQRQEGLQSNLVFLREEKEILILHQMHRFSDNEPYALIVMHLRPYELQDILESIKMTRDESVLVLNDADELIEADYGELRDEDLGMARSAAEQLRGSEKKETVIQGNYWFYREASGGKLRILLSVPDHVIVDSLKRTVLVSVLTGAAMILASAAGAVLFSRLLSQSIIQLARRMRNFTLGGEEHANDGAFAVSGRASEEAGSSAISVRAPESSASSEPSGTDEENSVSASFSETRNEIAILQQSFEIMVERNEKLIAQEYQAELEKREAQVHALQAQINPHFMYNVMQVIGGMALEREAPEIYNVTTALGDLMRYCLNFSREMVALQEEIHYLQSYCMLQNERFGGRIALEIDVEEAALKRMIPKLILQPVLENSFHHGLASQSGSWIITVRGRLESPRKQETKESGEAECLVLTVTDNGRGIAPDNLARIRENLKKDAKAALHTGAHIGLRNVDARIRLRYPGPNSGVTIFGEEGKGTTVVITMEDDLQHEL